MYKIPKILLSSLINSKSCQSNKWGVFWDFTEGMDPIWQRIGIPKHPGLYYQQNNCNYQKVQISSKFISLTTPGVQSSRSSFDAGSADSLPAQLQAARTGKTSLENPLVRSPSSLPLIPLPAEDLRNFKNVNSSFWRSIWKGSNKSPWLTRLRDPRRGSRGEKRKVSTLKSCQYMETSSSSRPLFKVLLGYFNYKHIGFFFSSLRRWKDNFNIRRRYIKACHFDAKCFKWIEFFCPCSV